MLASTVTSERCELFCVVRTDMSTPDWTRVRLPYAPRDYMGAVKLAAKHQSIFDPHRARFDYRVDHCD